MKAQYKEAYRVAKIIKGMGYNLQQAMDFVTRFKWSFTLALFAKTYQAII